MFRRIASVSVLHAACLVFGVLLGSANAGAQSGFALPLSPTTGGAYALTLRIPGGENAEANFLLDTGAAMMTINGELFSRLRRSTDVRETREVAVRLADGRRRLFSVYEVEGLQLSDGCELGTVEAVVIPGKGRNLMGLNVLQGFAPITLSIDPPVLSVSGCSTAGMPVAALP